MENVSKQYELICILEPHLEAADLDGFKKSIEKMLTDNNGQLIHFMDPQKRDLTYPINKQLQGIYITSHISLNPENVINFLKELKTNKQILRHLISILETSEEGEKPKKVLKPRTKKTIEEKSPMKESVSAKTPEGKSDQTNLEEIDKKLDELMGEI